MTSKLDIQQMIIDAANRLGVPTNIALGIASHESGFNATATNKNTNGTTDYGVMQLNTSTVQTLGVADPLDPQQNIDAGVGLLATLLRTYNGDVGKALWAYADGAGNVAKNRMSDVAQQFIGYVTGYGGGTAVDPTKRVPPPQMIRTLVASKLKPKPTPGSVPLSGSGSSHLAGWFLATISLLCLARVQGQGVRQDTITLIAPAPAAVTQVSTNVSGPRGGVRYSYWVIANYPGGSAQPAGTIETNAPTALSGSSFVTIQWSPISGATSYDVLRTNTEAFPSAPCTCAVATAVSGSSTTDTGSALSLYVWTPKLPATGSIRIDNSGAAPAFITSPSLGGGTVDATAIKNGNAFVTTGTGTAYTGCPSTSASLAPYQIYLATFNVANTSTTPTLNICGSTKTLVHADSSLLAIGEIGPGYCTAFYDGTNIELTGTCLTGPATITLQGNTSISVPLSGFGNIGFDTAAKVPKGKAADGTNSAMVIPNACPGQVVQSISADGVITCGPGGGGGTPGGSPNELQWNSAGGFAGIGSSDVSGTNFIIPRDGTFGANAKVLLGQIGGAQGLVKFVDGVGNPVYCTAVSNAIDAAGLNCGPIGGASGVILWFRGGMQLIPSGSQYTCGSNTRGMFWVTDSGAGVKDKVEVCAKDAADAYAWRTIY